MSRKLLFVPLLLAMSVVQADEAPEKRAAAAAVEAPAPTEEDAKTATGAAAEENEPEQTEGGAKLISGMSILGNQEAPKSLVIVPWKGSELGDSLGIAPMLDASRQPIDKEVFMRALKYYEIRSERTP